MNKLTFVAFALTLLACAKTSFALPKVPPLENPRRMEVRVPKHKNLLACIPASNANTALQEVIEPPSALTLRGSMSGRAPSLTVLRFGGGRGLEPMSPLKWAPCPPSLR